MLKGVLPWIQFIINRPNIVFEFHGINIGVPIIHGFSTKDDKIFSRVLLDLIRTSSSAMA